MKQLLTALGFISITCLFIACNSNTANEAGTNTAAETTSTFDLAAVKKTIDSTNTEIAALVAKSDSVGISNFYTSDAKLMGYNMPAASGKAAIKSAFGGMINEGISGIKITTSDVWGTEALVGEEGTFSLMTKDGKEVDKGKYIVLWKMEDSKWKLFRDCFNSDLPCPCPTK